jgi:hypothetical protein
VSGMGLDGGSREGGSVMFVLFAGPCFVVEIDFLLDVGFAVTVGFVIAGVICVRYIDKDLDHRRSGILIV